MSLKTESTVKSASLTKDGSSTKNSSPRKDGSSTKNSSPRTDGSPTNVSKTSVIKVHNIEAAGGYYGPDEDYYITPEFIYGGPFIPFTKPSTFIDSATPMNLTLQGTFRMSFAYFSLKDRLPHILTKIIDYASREGGKIRSNYGAKDDELRKFIESVVKLKNDLVTNKTYDHFTIDTEEGEQLNRLIDGQPNQKYFNNLWVFTECYVYRKIYENCELYPSLQKFDYFEEQKQKALQDHVPEMCMVAKRVVVDMLPLTLDKAVRKANFMTLLKICLWANKCDLSFSCGEKVTLAGGIEDGPGKPKPLPPAPPPPPTKKGKKPSGPLIVSPEPFQMVLDLKERLIIDESGKISDQVCSKAEALANKIAGENPEPPPPAPAEGQEVPEPPKIPCPSKMVTPNTITFDIVCDNAGYELFTDLCLASFLIEQEIVERVRFHLKRMPWFVSDATPKDFQNLIDACVKASYSGDPPPEPVRPGVVPPEDAPPPETVTSDNLRVLGEKFKTYVNEGKFLPLAEDFWTLPIVYNDMKKTDYWMYRKLQLSVAVLFKGDLNYRKLLGDRNPNPYTKFAENLREFKPAPVIAVRTVKSETICGMGKGKYDALMKVREDWMTTGDYGLIQWCPKGEPLKVADRPCFDYGDECRGTICPDHKHDL